MRKQGESVAKVTEFLSKKSIDFKNEFLLENGVNFNDLPNWKKRGIGLYWENYEKPAIDGKTAKETICIRRQIKVDMDLPLNFSLCEKRSYGAPDTSSGS